MLTIRDKNLDELARVGSLLSGDMNAKQIISHLVEQALDISESDLACLYTYEDPESSKSDLSLHYKRGRYNASQGFSADSPLVDFIEDCSQAVVLLSKRPSPFSELFLNPLMKSGIALPLTMPKRRFGILILNDRRENFYGRQRLQFLSSFVRMASSMLRNSELFTELKEQYRQVEALERYQENIFSSMTNLLITTDETGNIHYFNDAARERLGLSEEELGQDFHSRFIKSLSKNVKNNINAVKESGGEILGINGIYRNEGKDIDFSLNVSPLKTKRGKYEGLTLLFTDQSKERELKEQMKIATEERRIIKDMFSRYMSMDVVQSLMEQPDLVKPGGDKKNATIFFADIRGYTSFSEGKSPEYIVEILNEYFSEAVEIVIKHKGYIDKFIGDCIMAAWGVPTYTEEEDAYRAVSAAVEIQELVNSPKRSFFTGEASKLKVGIGMHTGPLVAGNIGSARRMDYSVIGDTVNVAARLEGVAAADEIIITENTRNYLKDLFVLEEREPVYVKGKSRPIPIYKVIRKAG